MTPCWETEADNRPTFDALLTVIKREFGPQADDIYLYDSQVHAGGAYGREYSSKTGANFDATEYRPKKEPAYKRPNQPASQEEEMYSEANVIWQTELNGSFNNYPNAHVKCNDEEWI